MKLICFGDSLTQGTYGGSYVDTLAHLMPEHTIINAGRNGDTIVNLLERLDGVLAQSPDGIFLMVGGNDAISYAQPKVRSYYRKSKGIEEGFVSPEQFSAAYRDLLLRLQVAGVLVWVGLPPNEYNPTVVNTLRQYNTFAQESAQSLGIPVHNFMADFVPSQLPERPDLDIKTIILIGARESSGWHDYQKARAEGGYSFTFDGLHLMPEAAEQMARSLVPFLGQK
ncbi:MAG: SGNH/GDSL hydrolase family protein [Anaerolineae bacterium]|nr:SGNH/GDSL hydrolase family protein [Anaerolineae bacterium]